MDEARQRGMRVWLLDDAHFPTGFANGQIRDKHPELAKYYLNYKQIDICGPQPDIAVNANGFLNLFDWMQPQEKLAMADEIMAVVAGQVDDQGQLQAETLQDLSAAVKDGYLHWDVPAGSWRVFVLIKTKNWGGNPDYINMVDRRSVRVLIDAVYEPHYARYAADFGKTFAGFFSDEPSFGNSKGYNFDESIGRKKMVLPWSDELAQSLSKDLTGDFPRLLPGLWQNAGKESARVRQTFMDCATRLYDQDFAGQNGQWCRERGVEYIGHVIEDQNVHARLGCGSGHFFRRWLVRTCRASTSSAIRSNRGWRHLSIYRWVKDLIMNFSISDWPKWDRRWDILTRSRRAARSAKYLVLQAGSPASAI